MPAGRYQLCLLLVGPDARVVATLDVIFLCLLLCATTACTLGIR